MSASPPQEYIDDVEDDKRKLRLLLEELVKNNAIHSYYISKVLTTLDETK